MTARRVGEAPLEEVFLSDAATAKATATQVRAGKARKLGPRLYTSNMTDAAEDIVRRNLWRIAALLAPGSVVSYRTAIELRPSPTGLIYLVGRGRHDVDLPGVRLRITKGPGPQPGDNPYMGSLFLASRERALLECLAPTRRRAGESRGLPRATAETWLEEQMRLNGEEALNGIRDRARMIAPALGAEEEFALLDGLVGTLLGSKQLKLSSPAATARGLGRPYDSHRIALFAELQSALAARTLPVRRDTLTNGEAFQNLAFFDAYFSNYIEGTRFELAEAHAIVFDGQIPKARPEDAHDIMGTFRLVGRREFMARGLQTIEDYAAFEERLRAAHRELLGGRPDKHPGEFKEIANKAGNTLFVAPGDVRGTLEQGFQLSRGLQDPFARAAMIMFVLSEVHPFDDGNGRIARAFMNVELVSAMQRRILIPTSLRDDYLTGLRALSRQRHPVPFIETLEFAQRYTDELPAVPYDEAVRVLGLTGAFDEGQERGQSGLLGTGAPKLRLPSSLVRN